MSLKTMAAYESGSKSLGQFAKFLALVLMSIIFAASAAAAQTLIRDAEIERTLEQIAHPVLRVAGLNPRRVHLYIVKADQMNAFVAGGNNIFLSTGMLTRLRSIDQLRSVIAHETGHITGGHLTRRDEALRGAKGIAVIGLLAATAAAAGGSPQAGIAIASGAQSVAHRAALAHSRAEEASADQAGLRYAAAAGSDPRAMLEVLRFFRGQDALTPTRRNPYLQTHPLWSERIALIEDRASNMSKGAPPSAEEAYWYDRMVAKLDAFLQAPEKTLERFSGNHEISTLSKAIAWHRRPDVAKSIAAADRLIALRPDDAFYHELRGQFLLETGKAQAAAQSYRQAVSLASKEPLILGGLGRALLNMDDPGATAEARDVLADSARRDRANPGVLHDLALAEARLGNDGAAALATAERYSVLGQFKDATRNASRASGLLPKGSPGWQRAQDVITVSRRALK
jgi:predicted Zn-dependent protease